MNIESIHSRAIRLVNCVIKEHLSILNLSYVIVGRKRRLISKRNLTLVPFIVANAESLQLIAFLVFLPPGQAGQAKKVEQSFQNIDYFGGSLSGNYDPGREERVGIRLYVMLACYVSRGIVWNDMVWYDKVWCGMCALSLSLSSVRCVVRKMRRGESERK